MKTLHPVSDQAPPERTKAFWLHLRWFIETIWALFGGPESIAALRQITRRDHKVLAGWLRAAETLARKLLVIEAADVQIAERKRKARTPARREAITRLYNADEPHQWRVSFRVIEGMGDTYLLPRKRIRVPEQCPRQRFAEAWPLAERFEALLRVFDAPERYVQRVARLLQRAPARIKTLAAPAPTQRFSEIFEPLRPLLLEAYGALTRDRLACDTS